MATLNPPTSPPLNWSHTPSSDAAAISSLSLWLARSSSRRSARVDSVPADESPTWMDAWRRMSATLAAPNKQKQTGTTTTNTNTTTSTNTNDTNRQTGNIEVLPVENEIPTKEKYLELFGGSPLTDPLVVVQCKRCQRTLHRSAFPSHWAKCEKQPLLPRPTTHPNAPSPHRPPTLSASPPPDAPATPTTKIRKRKQASQANTNSTDPIAEEDGGSGSGAAHKKKMKLNDPDPVDDDAEEGTLLDDICGVSLTAPPLDPSSIVPPPLASHAGHATQDLCHNPLNCRVHSVPQKKAVPGRSMSFVYLLGRQNSMKATNATNAVTTKKEKKTQSKKVEVEESSSSDDSSDGDSDSSDVSSSDDEDASGIAPGRLARRRSVRDDHTGSTSRVAAVVKDPHVLSDYLTYPPNTRSHELIQGVSRLSGTRTWSRTQRHTLAARCWNLANLIGTSGTANMMMVNTPIGTNPVTQALAERQAAEYRAREVYQAKAKTRGGPMYNGVPGAPTASGYPPKSGPYGPNGPSGGPAAYSSGAGGVGGGGVGIAGGPGSAATNNAQNGPNTEKPKAAAPKPRAPKSEAKQREDKLKKEATKAAKAAKLQADALQSMQLHQALVNSSGVGGVGGSGVGVTGGMAGGGTGGITIPSGTAGGQTGNLLPTTPLSGPNIPGANLHGLTSPIGSNPNIVGTGSMLGGPLGGGVNGLVGVVGGGMSNSSSANNLNASLPSTPNASSSTNVPNPLTTNLSALGLGGVGGLNLAGLGGLGGLVGGVGLGGLGGGIGGSVVGGLNTGVGGMPPKTKPKTNAKRTPKGMPTLDASALPYLLNNITPAQWEEMSKLNAAAMASALASAAASAGADTPNTPGSLAAFNNAFFPGGAGLLSPPALSAYNAALGYGPFTPTGSVGGVGVGGGMTNTVSTTNSNMNPPSLQRMSSSNSITTNMPSPSPNNNRTIGGPTNTYTNNPSSSSTPNNNMSRPNTNPYPSTSGGSISATPPHNYRQTSYGTPNTPGGGAPNYTPNTPGSGGGGTTINRPTTGSNTQQQQRSNMGYTNTPNTPQRSDGGVYYPNSVTPSTSDGSDFRYGPQTPVGGGVTGVGGSNNYYRGNAPPPSNSTNNPSYAGSNTGSMPQYRVPSNVSNVGGVGGGGGAYGSTPSGYNSQTSSPAAQQRTFNTSHTPSGMGGVGGNTLPSGNYSLSTSSSRAPGGGNYNLNSSPSGSLGAGGYYSTPTQSNRNLTNPMVNNFPPNTVGAPPNFYQQPTTTTQGGGN